MVHVVDADDFCPQNNALETLHAIKRRIPNFKITLFTILGRCPESFLAEARSVPWIDLVPHGWMHTTNFECASWSYAEGQEYLDRIEPLGLTHGFKAPGWQISGELEQALMSRKYWIAYNHRNYPPQASVYLYFDSPLKHHYHLWRKADMENMAALDPSADYAFVKDVVE